MITSVEEVCCEKKQRKIWKLCFGIARDWGPKVMNSQMQAKLWKCMLSSKGNCYVWARDHSVDQKTFSLISTMNL